VSGSREPTPEQVAARRMVETLGGRSSHPRYLASRLRWIWWISTLPILAVLAYFAHRAWRVLSAVVDFTPSIVVPRVVDLLKDIFVVGPWFIVAYACGVALSFTAILTLRASSSQAHAARSWSGAGAAWTTILLGSLACVGICALAAWAGQTTRIPLADRWWIVLFSMLPMYAVLGAIEISELRQGGGGRSAVGVIRWIMFAPAVVATLVLSIPASTEWLTVQLFGLLDRIAVAAQSPVLADVVAQLRLQQVEELITRVLGLFVAVAVMIIAGAQVRSIRRRLLAQARDRAEKPARKKGCLGRILAFLGLGRDEVEEEGPTGEPQPAARPEEAWFTDLAEAAASAGLAFEPTWHAGERERSDVGRSSPPWASDEYDWLFAGERPSTDQVRLLRSFEQLWYQHLTIVEQEMYGADRESHADLLVEAEEGSGSSSVVAACAAFASVARGQRVLVIARSRSEQDATVVAIRDRFARFGFESLFEVSALRPDAISGWCPPSSDPRAVPAGDPPDVAVATLADYEQVFCAGAYEEGRLRAVQRSMEVVIVEKVDRLIEDDVVRLHLPFVLDKHRLLLRSENRAMQLLMTCRPLGRPPEPTDDAERPMRPIASVARMRLAARFFGGDGGLDGRRDPDADDRLDPKRRTAHLAYLRRIARDRAAVLELQVAAVPREGEPAAEEPRTDAALVEDATQWLVRRLQRDGGVALLAAGDRPAALPPGLGEGASAPRAAGLATWEVDRDSLDGVKWVVAMEPLTRRQLDDAAAKVAGLSGAALVVVATSPLGLGRRGAPPPVFPVFPAPTSPALFVSHLRSAVGALRPDVPIRREQFARFGLDWEAESDVLARRDAGATPLEESWSLELDRGLPELLRGDDVIWPAIFVRHQEGFTPRPVDLIAPLDAGLCLLREGHHLRSGRRAGLGIRPDRQRFATWMTRRGLELGRSDLAYFKPVLHDGLRQSFRAIQMQAGSDGTRIIAEPISPDGGDQVLPVRRTRVVVPSDVSLRSPQVIRAVNAFIFGLHESSSGCVSHEAIVALSPRVEETARGGEVDLRPMPIMPPVRFDLQVGVTILAVGGTFPAEDADASLRSLYEGEWDTAVRPGRTPTPRDPWHGLARVFAYAIEKTAPSLLSYANAYAFRPPRGMDGATILLVEPMGTQGTALEAMTTILDDAALREQFLRHFEDAIRRGLRSGVATRIEGDDLEEDSPESRAQLLGILEVLRTTSTPPAAAEPDDRSSTRRGPAVIEPPSATSMLPERPAPPRTAVAIAPEANLRWRDVNAASEAEWRSMGLDAVARSPEYGVLEDVPPELADAETASFGHHDGLDPDDVEALRAACVRIQRRASDPSVHVISADYEAMIERSIEPLRGLGGRLLAIAESGGLRSTRERVGLVASLVQSLEYVASREGSVDDGKSRLGVQLPVRTLVDRAGDCDSVSVLLAALLRASGIARSALVLIEEPRGGHMMVAVECESFEGDCRLASASGRLVLVEATNGFPIGHCDPQYHGRHVQVLAYG